MFLSYHNGLMKGILWQEDIIYQIGFEGIKANLKEEEVLFILNIPRINLREKVYTKDSSLNQVDLHVQILEESNLEKNFFFLAAHSGTSDVSYFNRIVELEKGDLIWLEEGEKRISFVVEDLFSIQKNGYFEYFSDEEQEILYLITCSLENSQEQLVVKSKLVY